MKTLLTLALLLITSLGTAADWPTCTALIAPPPKLPPGVKSAWAQPAKFWPQKATLRVNFLTGTQKQKAEAWKRFQVIDSYINLTFVQTTGPAEIRVRFDRKGHWSWMGTDARTVKASEPTMNLQLKAGWLGDMRAEWDRVALHEVCHAIGLEHEHQSPDATFRWNKEAVYARYGAEQGWSRQQIDEQVINRPRPQRYLSTGFDAQSLMLYPIPPGLANITVGWNDKLSPLDIAFLRRIYP
jgi:hypothetical protein